MSKKVSRRKYIAAAGAVAAAAIIGGTTYYLMKPRTPREVEFVHGSGGVEVERKALAAIIEHVRKVHPDIIVHEVATGGGFWGTLPLINPRLAAGNPPDVWQISSGCLGANYRHEGHIISLEEIWKDEPFDKKIGTQYMYEGEHFGVPLSIETQGEVWYNKKIFNELGINVPEDVDTIDGLFATAEKIKARGIAPFGFGDKDKWSNTYVWWTLYNTQYPSWAEDFCNGNADEEQISTILELFKKFTEYVHPAHTSFDWDAGAAQLAKGEAAMWIMGDWAKAIIEATGLKYKEDFDYFDFPAVTPIIGGYSVGLAVFAKAPHIDAALDFVRAAVDKEAIEAYCKIRCLIPPRTDISAEELDPFVQERYKRFLESEAIFPDQDAGINDYVVNMLHEVLAGFMATKNVKETAKKILDLQSEAHKEGKYILTWDYA